MHINNRDMKIYIILTLYIGVSESYYSMIRDPTILHVLFGNVSDMSDLRYAFKNNKIVMPEIKDDDDVEEQDPPDFKQLFKTIDDLEDHGNHTSDVNEFNKITKQLASIKFSFQNASYAKRKEREILARSESGRRVKFDGEDWWWMENNKKGKAKKLCLAFLMHTRFKVDMAVRQRKHSRGFKAYKIGYMYNRLRHIQYQMARLINVVQLHHGEVGSWSSWYDSYDVRSHQLRFLLRVYEKVMRLDVDNRDLIEQMNIVFEQKDPVITYDASSTEDDDDED